MPDFHNDDLELQAITTMLASLYASCFPELEPDSDNEGRSAINGSKFLQRFQLKHLLAISSLLSRDSQSIACTPNPSSRMLRLFVAVTTPASTITDLQELSLFPAPPIGEVGDDVYQFVVDNWNLSFPEHSQVVVKLLNDCLAAAGRNAEVWVRLSRYCLVQSAPKLSRYLSSKHLSVLTTALDSAIAAGILPTTNIPVMSAIDGGFFKAMIRRLNLFKSCTYLVVALETVPETLEVAPVMTLEVCIVFRKMLGEIQKYSNRVSSLRAAPSAPLVDTLRNPALKLWKLLHYLEYMAYYSNFFRWLFTEHLRDSLYRAWTTSPEATSGLVPENVDEDNIATWVNKNARNNPPEWRVLRWLRLLTATVHDACMFHKSQSLGMIRERDHQIVVEMLQVPPPGTEMSWVNVVKRIFPAADIDRVMHLFLEKLGDVHVKFSGSIHCAALLGALATPKPKGDLPQEILDAFYNTLLLVAPSRKCCPVCTQILLETCGIDTADSMGRHDRIVPCAFPPGVPADARKRVLAYFEGMLKDAVYAGMMGGLGLH